jgi:hypothetical protein
MDERGPSVGAERKEQGARTKNMEHTTDKEVWFVAGAHSIGLAGRKVPIASSRSAPSAARRLSVPTTSSREPLEVMVEV